MYIWGIIFCAHEHVYLWSILLQAFYCTSLTSSVSWECSQDPIPLINDIAHATSPCGDYRIWVTQYNWFTRCLEGSNHAVFISSGQSAYTIKTFHCPVEDLPRHLYHVLHLESAALLIGTLEGYPWELFGFPKVSSILRNASSCLPHYIVLLPYWIVSLSNCTRFQ